MSTLIVAAQFTEAAGQPAETLALAEIDLYLTRIHNTTGVDSVVWDGTQHPTVEIDNCGTYARLYITADLDTYTYFVSARYTGATVLDTDYVIGASGRCESILTVVGEAAVAAATCACVVGPGAIAKVYTITNSVTGLPLADVNVWATTDLAGLNTVASGVTNAIGQITFFFDSGVTYYMWRQKDGFTFTNPDIEVMP